MAVPFVLSLSKHVQHAHRIDAPFDKLRANGLGTRMPALPPLALIAGPTASGKSALALALAQRSGGVIINADASQVYAELRIVTARPSVEEEALAEHHLFGHVDAADTGYSAARWADEARATIIAAHDSGRLPILVGGTGLYMRTLLDGIAPIPNIDADIRAAVRALPVPEAYAALEAEDPAAAQLLAPADSARIARALEVVRSTGRPIGEWREKRSGGIGDAVDLRALILLPDRDWLNARIDARFEGMLANGAIEEVAALLSRTDVPRDAPILRAIGVPEIARLLGGTLTGAEASASGALASRQYAKRQYTWFRNQPPPTWRRISLSESYAEDDLLEILLRD